MADENIQEATTKINNATKELRDLLKEAKGPFRELKQTTETLNSAMKEFNEKLSGAINTQAGAAQELEKQKLASSRLRDMYGQYSGTLSGIIAIGKQNIVVAKEEANLTNARMQLAKQVMDATRSQLESAISEEEAIIQQATNRRELIDQERSMLGEFIKAKQEQVDASREDASYTRSALSAAQGELTASKSRLDAMRAQEDSIKSIIDANNEEARKLEGRGEFRGRGKPKEVSAEEQAQVSLLKAANEEHKRRYDELVAARKAEVAYRESMQSTVGQLETELTEKQSIQDALQGEYDTATSTMAKLNKERMFERTKIVEASRRLKEHIEGQSRLSKAAAAAAEAYEDVAAENTAKQQAVINTTLELYQKVLSDIISKLQKTAKVLLDLEKTIRDTQQQFGISAGQAANVKFGQLQESISSTFNTFMTLGRDARVSMEEIQAAQVAFQKEFGGVISTGAAAELAQQAKEMGLSVTELATARRAFLTTTLGNVDSAISQQERAIASFEAKGLTAKDAMEFVGKNAELVARAGTRFQDSLMKAAAVAKKIGVDLSKVNQVGDNIIGNFEGFLTSMAELGAMGFGFDAARLGAVAETGDTGALFEELRSQLAMTGKDITQLRRSEQLALSQAFGMDIAEFQRMAGIEVEGGGETMEDLQKKSNSLLERLVNGIGALGSLFAAVNTILGVVHTKLLFDIARKIGATIISGVNGAGGLIRRGVGAARGAAGRIGQVASSRIGRIRPTLGGVARGVGIGAVAGLAGGAAEAGGEALKESGKLKTGSAVSALGTTAKFAGQGAMLGSIIPGVGTALGAAVGGLIGAVVGITQNFEGFKAMFVDTFDAVKSAFTFVTDGVKSAFGFIIEKAMAIGSFIATYNPVSLMANLGKSIVGKVTGFFGGGETGDDVVSRPGYGDRTLVTQQGAIALNNQDNVVAYADDMISRAAAGITMLSKGALTQQSEAPVNNINVDMSALEKKLDQVVQAIGAMRVDLDGNKVGKVLLDGEKTTRSRATFLAQRVS